MEVAVPYEYLFLKIVLPRQTGLRTLKSDPEILPPSRYWMFFRNDVMLHLLFKHSSVCLPTALIILEGGWGVRCYRKQTYYYFRPELIIMHFVAFGKLAITSGSLVVIVFQLFNLNIPFLVLLMKIC